VCVCSGVADVQVEPDGALSEWSALSLEGGAIAGVGVPDGAKFYAWAFPLSSVARLRSAELAGFRNKWSATTPQTPELAFAMNGGLVFADDGFQTVGLSALCDPDTAGGGGGGGADAVGVLALDGPHPLDPSMRPKLEARNHCAHPTSIALRQAGVVWYTWVEPGEGLVGADGHDWCTGAFVFMCVHGTPHQRPHPHPHLTPPACTVVCVWLQHTRAHWRHAAYRRCPPV
jgi:hypothetical protein